jgi:HD-like signal output (HDOD) protein
MAEKHPFKLRDHGHKIIELMVHDVDIGPQHKSVETLQLLTRKFDQVIYTLEETATLSPDLLPVLLKVGEFGALKLVAEKPEQIPFDLHGLLRFKSVFDAVRRIVGERAAEKILKQIGRIGPIRSSAYNLLQMMRNPDVRFEDIEETAEKDPDLVFRMLKTANTAYFSRRLPVETLKAAVTYLGLEGIRQLLVHDLFDRFTKLFANQRDKLAHMRRCSHLAAFLGKQIKADLPTIGKMRVAGLVHDLGSLLFTFYDSREFSKVRSLVRKEKLTSAEAELRIFGVDHTYLGALYAKELGIPEYAISVIEKHHDQVIEEDDLVLMSVRCANGFLNDKIEQIEYSSYEPLLKRLAEEIDSKNPELQKALAGGADADKPPAAAKTEAENDGETPGKDKEADELLNIEKLRFRPMQFYGLLKEELDQFILAGA